MGDRVQLEAAMSALAHADNTARLAASCFDDLAEMFTAIGKLSGNSYTVEKLAGIGKYLAEDWGVLHEGEAEELTAHLEKLKKALDGLQAGEKRHG